MAGQHYEDGSTGGVPGDISANHAQGLTLPKFLTRYGPHAWLSRQGRYRGYIWDVPGCLVGERAVHCGGVRSRGLQIEIEVEDCDIKI